MTAKICTTQFGIALFVSLCVCAAASAVETISGQVTSTATSLPLVGIDLDVFDSSGASVTITGGSTAAGGTYTLTLPGPGTFTIRADATLGDGVADTFYNQVFLPSQAQSLIVATGESKTGINFSLPNGVQISGTITSLSSGLGLSGIDLDLFDVSGEFLNGYPGTTAVDGTYTIGALPPGSYIVRADPELSLGQQFVRTYFNGQSLIGSATPIVVGASNVTAIDIALPSGGSIAGRVTDVGTGLPLAGLDLDIFDSLGNRLEQNAVTDVNGDYSIGAVATGSFILRVDPTIVQGYPLTYYTTAQREIDAQLITVTAPTPTTGINFALGAGGTISGTVSQLGSGAPIANIDLDCYNQSGQRIAATAKSGAGGTYQIGPLVPGVYFLVADPTIAQGFAVQFYATKIDLAFANPITVVSSADTPGIDFTLEAAGSIQGLIRNSALTPLSGIDLDLYDAATNTRLDQNQATAVDGTYSFVKLPAGSYKVRADPTVVQAVAREYFNDQPTLGLADLVVVTTGLATLNTDFILSANGSISGQITSSLGGAPLAGIDLDIFDAATLSRLDQNAITDINGFYALAGLPPGSYIIRGDPPIFSAEGRTYYIGTALAASATPITVLAGQDTGNINIALLESSLPVSGLVGLCVLCVGLALFAAGYIRRDSIIGGKKIR